MGSASDKLAGLNPNFFEVEVSERNTFLLLADCAALHYTRFAISNEPALTDFLH